MNVINPVVLRITLRATLGRKRALVFVLTPVVLLAVTGVLRLVHLLATPVNRVSVVLSKFAAAVILTILFGAIPEFLAAAIAAGFTSKLTLGLLLGALVASVAYNAFFVMLSLLTTRAIAVGLGYLVLWEGLLGNLVGGVRLLSIGQYSVSVANAVAHTSALNSHLTLATAVVMAAAFTVATLVVAARRLSAFTLKGEPA